mmetsp:Transcript_22776/g.56201  ORF Transcript_22776/g.56201 Transcript_22776/m.56201 type:complete len:195 (-) Transcript_22776:147-731(-)|eukprot:CAMPEP_0197581012 /NCGR_PEP_ID=MMETSP1326-20131121/4663_1 /TAXON_ID=1155430 /ORGANISM="Genus nov. species nov., Strain RCC2288" /LENGTH=194 /DNA_ID=CAMNT_0043144855 /DNA_START=463 /DNA_END=1047 /DNA_ORIENTATION=-
MLGDREVEKWSSLLGDRQQRQQHNKQGWESWVRRVVYEVCRFAFHLVLLLIVFRVIEEWYADVPEQWPPLPKEGAFIVREHAQGLKRGSSRKLLEEDFSFESLEVAEDVYEDILDEEYELGKVKRDVKRRQRGDLTTDTDEEGRPVEGDLREEDEDLEELEENDDDSIDPGHVQGVDYEEPPKEEDAFESLPYD